MAIPNPTDVTAGTLTSLGHDMCHVASMLSDACSLLRATDAADPGAVQAGVLAICQKAGFLTDRCSMRLGVGPMRGSFEQWADVAERRRAPAEATHE